LIVDDHDGMRLALRVLLEAQGVAVVGEAPDGSRGVQMAQALLPDVVILDGRMPVMNGEEAARVLRDVLPAARILAFSASFESRPWWADAFVPKERFADVLPTIEEMVVAA
jgi:DNA-binding NarL/FixJ family response regulator